MRCVHESKMHEQNSFLTLTFADEHLPKNCSLAKSDLQKFFRYLRKDQELKFSYFAAGEYGDETNRAHYHALIFGHDWADKVLYEHRKDGDYYMSPSLNKWWGKGNVMIGAVTFKSAAYVARYVLKKLHGDQLARYQYLDAETGELITMQQPFGLMSKAPAIGRRWLETYYEDVYNKDGIVMNGQLMKPPKYYDEWLKKRDPARLEKIKAKRQEEAKPLTDAERAARAEIHKAKLTRKTKV